MNIVGNNISALRNACSSREEIKFDAIKNIIVLKNGCRINVDYWHSSEQSYIYDLIRPFRVDITL